MKINDNNLNNKNVFPISIPEKNYYYKNIQQYKEEPINYIMRLFDKYDIVILCERIHPEYTQWDFFSDLILNETFATKVQNVFTEFGNAHNQKQLDTYMNTRFSTEEDLQRATAKIVRENGGCWPLWPNTNIYDFILRLHQYNQTKDSLYRVNLHFTDIFNWNEINNSDQWNSLYRSPDRDSLMADHIINCYKTQNIKKCLLITNTKHAWNYEENEVNEAAYIFREYPDKTAVVWINCSTQALLPAMNGSLDAAALEVPDSVWAIDFENCPLGNTSFDLIPIKRERCSYKDLFVGMIYFKHPNDWIFSYNYPYILDNFKDTLLKRSAFVGEKYVDFRKKEIEEGYYDRIYSSKGKLTKVHNLLFLSIHSIILLFLSLNLLIRFFSLLIRNKLAKNK